MRSLAALALAFGCAQAADYAVLVATSQSYMNYRHQADVSHAYQVLTSGGVPASNIITFMYDDIAHNSENPFPGKIFNKPTKRGVAGRDVYAGVKIDYKGEDVTPENFLSVITGDASAVKGAGTGRVLKSTSKDRVFINMVDHGAPGLVAFPSKMLYKEDLQKALQTMHSKGMYKQLVFYLEACESGSMFEDIPTNIEVYATTASNAKESSWGTYCGSDAMVDGKNINSCLGDLYSVNWMQNADKKNLAVETLQGQYKIVKQETNKSHVMQYGQLSIAKDPAGDFEGEEKRNVTDSEEDAGLRLRSAVDSRDAALVSRFASYMAATSPAEKTRYAGLLVEEVRSRERADAAFAAIAAKAAPGLAIPEAATMTYRACHKAADAAVQQWCGGYSDYSLKHVRSMINLCEALGGDAPRVTAAVRDVCA
eukprot:TRINITY_DN523_c0_g1_i8.p1 TRINITY_DN523_c0_g1~~TRINITY_DN523_c0_g1_i8.p1  ORF type:complete len:462 (+),score=192.33 TRINITY_DN523_c0_g1_i8:114-1388(+)